MQISPSGNLDPTTQPKPQMRKTKILVRKFAKSVCANPYLEKFPYLVLDS